MFAGYKQRRGRTTLRLWAPLAATMVALCIGGAIQAEGKSSAGTSTVLRLHVKAVSVKLVDNPPTGKLGAGDQLLLTEVATRGTTRVGHSVVAETMVNDAQDSEVSFTMVLANGDIQYAGFSPGHSTTEPFAIVGGTGRYSNAHGYVVASTTDSAGLEHNLTFHFQ